MAGPVVQQERLSSHGPYIPLVWYEITHERFIRTIFLTNPEKIIISVFRVMKGVEHVCRIQKHTIPK
jgi:hypothetical protein